MPTTTVRDTGTHTGTHVGTHVGTVTPARLRRLLDGDEEVAVLDVRDPVARAAGHLVRSAPAPLHDLERRARGLVPRLGTVVVVASDPALDDQAAAILAGLGYERVHVLEGGLDAWRACGGRTYAGTHVLGTALGEWIRTTSVDAGAGVDDVRARARQTLEAAGVERVDAAGLARLVADPTRTTYVVDVRGPAEHAAGHVPGSLHVPGDRLVRAVEEHLAVRRAHVVIVDDADLLRSAATVARLRHLHDGPVHVHVHDGAAAPVPVPVPDVPVVDAVTGHEMAAMLRARVVSVVDLRSSAAYAAGHVGGSVHARREQLPSLLPGLSSPVVLVGDDDLVPDFIAAEADRLLGGRGDVHILEGGIDAFPGNLTTADPSYAGPVVDRAGPPPSGPEGDAWHRARAAWAAGLLAAVAAAGDPDLDFDAGALGQSTSIRGLQPVRP
ncbi:rhodanese-like domain-containing protein [Nocardioides dongxiaopingii]|uniref:rhodanese-like domain-containing protein n=1 Tax=Nocardioides sp. S-1144 TaxID=2582905 RepID=UPI0016523A9F|nr:rhodanese-like domain-containing protein [Nocardioides sp. S-1144]